MQFEHRHTFPYPAQQVWDLIMTEAYDQDSARLSGLTRQPLCDEVVDGCRFRRIQVTSNKPLPRFMVKVIRADRLTYTLEERYAASGMRMDWTVIPMAVSDKVVATGSFEIHPTPQGCERLVSGRIRVSIPLVGGKIERTIADELQASYAKTAAFADSWLAERLP